MKTPNLNPFKGKAFAFSLLFLTGVTSISLAQQSVTIGDTQTKSNAVLYLKGNGSQGLIVPIVSSLGNFGEDGMIVFNSSDNTLYFHNGSDWVAAGSDGGGGGADPVVGNEVTQVITGRGGLEITGSGTSASPLAVGLVSGTTEGQVLKWDNTNKRWVLGTDNSGSVSLNSAQILVGNASNVATAVTMSGDAVLSNAGALTLAANSVSGGVGGKITDGSITSADLATGAVTSTVIADATIAAADLNTMGATSGQVLKFNGTNWAPAADNTSGSLALNSAQILVGNASNVATAVTMSGDATLTNAGAIILAAGSVSGGAGGKITDGSITAADLNTMGATSGQVLKYNGTNWAPAADNTSGSLALNSAQILVGNASNVATAVTMSGDATLTNAGAITLGANSVSGGVGGKITDASIVSADLATGAVTSTNILDATIAAADLNAMGATNGQVLKYNGTNWAPAVDGGGISTTLNSAQILVGNATNVATPVTMSGDATLTNAGAITLAANSVSGGVGGKITDASIVSADLATGAVTSTNILDATIAAADLNAMGATSGQVLKYNGTNWAPAAESAGWGLTGNTGTNPATNFIGTTDAQPLLFKTGVGGIERMRIGAAGNVGIGGVTTPNAPLHLANAVGRRIILWEQANNDHQFIGFGVDGAGTLNYQVPVNSNDHVFLTGTSSTTSNELMRIRGIGNVGIGTATPTERLDVSGNVRFSGALLPNNLAGTAGQVLTSAGAGLPPTWTTVSGVGYSTLNSVPKGDGAGLIASLITDDGTTVGVNGDINLTTGNFFSINGSRVVSNAGTANIFVGGNTANVNTASNNSFFGQAAGRDNTSGGDNTFIGRNAGLVNTTGTLNVMLGSNTGELSNGSSNVFLGYRAGAANTTGSRNIMIGRETNLTAGTFQNAIAIGYQATVGASNAMALGGAVGSGNEVNVGIGLTTPTERLHVDGNIRFTGALMPNNTAGTAGQVLTSAGAGVTPTWTTPGSSSWGLSGNSGTVFGTNFIGTSDNVGLSFKTNNEQRMFIDPSGRVTININNAVPAATVISNSILDVIPSGTGIGNITLRGSNASQTDPVDIEFRNWSGSNILGKIYMNPSNPDLFLSANSNVGTPHLIVASTGRVGVLTTTPDTDFEVSHGSAGPASGNGFTLTNSPNSRSWHMFVNNAGDLELYNPTFGLGTAIGTFSVASGFYSSASDRRLKKNIEPIEPVISNLMQVNVRRYHFKIQADSEQKNIGVIAQEIKEVFPELVKYNPEKDAYTVDYTSMAPLAIKAIQEQQKMISDMQQRVAELESQLKDEASSNSELKAQVEKLSGDISLIKQYLQDKSKTTSDTENK
ncbi:MAG TPA: tail fiber domain-containing protein [Ohtaekwangia sp.]